MLDREELFQAALSLEPDDRAALADALDESLHRQCFATPEIAEAWTVELEQRAAALDRGEIASEDWRTVIARLRNRTPAGDRVD